MLIRLKKADTDIRFEKEENIFDTRGILLPDKIFKLGPLFRFLNYQQLLDENEKLKRWFNRFRGLLSGKLK
jgi:hypothetical protein